MKRFFFLLLGCSAAFVSCKSQKSSGGGAAQAAMGAAKVSVVTVKPETVVIRREFPARVVALRVAQVRARVPGVLLKRTFEEGSYVKEGQLLFEIDPEPLRAAQASAKANLLKAQAVEQQAASMMGRLGKIRDARALRQQDVDDAKAALMTAQAGVLAAEAAGRTADLNLGYARVTAPISGQTSRAMVTEGALVGQGEATELVRIEQLSRVYVDFAQTNAEVQAMKVALAAGVDGKAKAIEVLLEGGTVLPSSLELKFSEMSVNADTSMTAVRGEVANEGKVLLPGMFVRVSVPVRVFESVLRVPMQAVSRDVTGKAVVLVVNGKNEIEPRVVEIAGELGGDWVVTSGLAGGSRVVMEGQMKVRPGGKVEVEAYEVKAKVGR